MRRDERACPALAFAMPSSPHRTIKIRKVNPRRDGTIEEVEPPADDLQQSRRR